MAYYSPQPFYWYENHLVMNLVIYQNCIRLLFDESCVLIILYAKYTKKIKAVIK